jgi:C4-dicarboxylate-specific signal transduction histidine kinase
MDFSLLLSAMMLATIFGYFLYQKIFLLDAFFNKPKDELLEGLSESNYFHNETELYKTTLSINTYSFILLINVAFMFVVFLPTKFLFIPIVSFMIIGFPSFFIMLIFVRKYRKVAKEHEKYRLEFINENQRLRTQEEQQKRFAYLSQMATAVAHNINNPLNNINATVTNIQDDLNMNAISNETLNQDLQRIKANIQRMAKIVSTFRSYARGNREQQEVIVFNEIIDNILMMFQGQFESHQVQLNKELTTHETKIFANTFELQEIFMILLTNAREAVESKTNAAIWVSTEQDEEKVYLQVEDNGTGISPEREKELFLPLNTSKANGFGMGLYLVKNILDKSKGYINYQKSIHGGACFRISLPIYKG